MLNSLKTFGRASMIAALAATGTTGLAHAGQTMTVHKSPTCGCCEAWIDRMEDAGFDVVARDTQFMQSIKREHGISRQFASCHTAIIGGYVIEGHVPAKEIRKLLKHQYKVNGLAVPGMPAGSPGMEMGGRKDSYNVIAFTDEKAGVFASY